MLLTLLTARTPYIAAWYATHLVNQTYVATFICFLKIYWFQASCIYMI